MKKITLLKKNIIANYLGQGWAAVMSIIFIPLYIKCIGVEAYGLIGVFAILQAWLAILDMGMAPTLNREMARFKAGASDIQSILNLLRTIEWICVLITALIVTSVWLLSPIIASSWFKLDKLSVSTVTYALIIMGFVVSARLWEEVYRASIRGMQQHVWLNTVQAILATFRWGGALVILIFISPTVEAFFLWQGLTSIISVIIYAYKTYEWLSSPNKYGKFSLNIIKEVCNFAGGMLTITVLSVLLTQVDKLLLSGLLSLEEFGYYVLAGVVTGGLSQLITPINATIYPKFTELVTRNDEVMLIKTYHSACQLMSAIIIPPALILAFFSKPILMVWTGSIVQSSAVAPILSILIIGTLFNGLMNIPYMLQLAYGWTTYAIQVNLVAVLIIVPAILLAVPVYGAIAAAWIWLVLNVMYVFVAIHFMYLRLMPNQKWVWYWDSIVKPLTVGTLVSICLFFLLPNNEGRLNQAAILLFAVFCVAVSVCVTMPTVRNRILNITKFFE